jgi:hypothetical protein
MTAFDPTPLWNFSDPAASQARFEAALPDASQDDQLIIQTQIARSHGLRKDFARAQNILRTIEPHIANASPVAKVRYFLELGRTYSSSKHSPESQTEQAKQMARAAFTTALDLAQNNRLDALAIDAVHMFAFVDV